MVESLETVLEHRAINLLEHVQTDFDLVVGPDTKNVRVEGGVVQLAERHPVGNHRMPLGVTIGQDVSRLE